MFSELIYSLVEYNAIITNRNDGQHYKEQTNAVVSSFFYLSSLIITEMCIYDSGSTKHIQ